MTVAEIGPVPGQRFAEQLDFLRAFPAYTTRGDGTSVVLWYRADGSVRSLGLRALPSGGVAVEGDVALARRILRVGAPPPPPVAGLPLDPAAHRTLRRRHGGIRPVLFADPFEGICWTILGQQVTVALAVQMKEALARRHGDEVPGADGSVFVFPGPQRIAALGLPELRAAKLSGQKAEALRAVAAAVASGAWDPATLARQPTAEALERLLRFPGIGRWTAEYVLLRVAGHPDVLPVGDAGLQRAWARLTGRQGRAGAEELLEAGRAWAGWRSDFAFSLWLDNLSARRQGLPGA